MERARRFAAALAHPTLVDTSGALARALDFRAVPNGFCFDREGRLVGEVRGSFDIRTEETRALVEGWLAPHAQGRIVAPRDDPLAEGDAGAAAGDLPGAGAAYGRALGERRDSAPALFALGSVHLRAGRTVEALRLWHRAYLLDPRNFLIRKQIWRALYPERFGDSIDVAWQKEQVAREQALGFGAANPKLPRWTPD